MTGKLNPTDSTRQVQGYSPVPLPDPPSLEPYLQNVEQEHRKSDSVGDSELNHY